LPIDFSGSGMGFFSVWWDGRFYWVLWWLDVVFGVVKMVNRMVECGQEMAANDGLARIWTDSKQATACTGDVGREAS
jgi:hypothetical protein